jgi:hypothetical protein
LGVVAGAYLLVFPHTFVAKATRIHAARVAELKSGAAEAHFEELRELEAYPPPSRASTARLIGGALLMIGCGLVALSFLLS